MGRNKFINQHFLDDPSRITCYIRGASYFIYRSLVAPVTIFSSRHEKLIELILSASSADYTKSSDNRSNRSFYWINFGKTPYLYEKMSEFGLNVPREEIEFPTDIPKEFMRDFVRGFLDSGSWMKIKNRNRTYLRVDYCHSFVVGLNKTLIELAEIERGEPEGDSVSYNHNNALKVGKFIYGGFEQIKNQGIYLPCKKEMFKTKTGIVENAAVTRARKKIKDAKKLLLQGEMIKDAAIKVGYKSPSTLTIIFKKVTGMNPREWLKVQHQKN